MISTKKKEGTVVLLTRSFFHRDFDASQTVIWLWPKQRQALNTFYKFTYFF